MTFRTLEVSDPTLAEAGLTMVTVKSPALGRRADVTLFAPPGRSAGPLPLVMLLHGVYGSHWAWCLKGGAHRELLRLMARGETGPMLLAMPSDGLWGDGSGYLSHRGADAARWVVDEVPEIAAQVEPRTAGGPRFIAGLSMGGYGALRLGAIHAERFSGISAHSSITDFTQMEAFIEEPLDLFKLAGGQPTRAVEALVANRDRLPPLRFDCGLEDVLLPHSRELHRELEAAGVPHVYEEFGGGHTWDYWSEHLADTLRFFQRVIDGRHPDGNGTSRARAV